MNPPPARRLIVSEPCRVNIGRSISSDAGLLGSSRTSNALYAAGPRNFRSTRSVRASGPFNTAMNQASPFRRANAATSPVNGGTAAQTTTAAVAPVKAAAATNAGAAVGATPAPKETTKDRRAREAREREVREADARAANARLVAPATGTVRIAISPWGLVEVDGTSSGAAPPITELTLAEGRHQIVIRNGDYPAYTTQVNVTAGQTVTLRHKFGS